MKTKADFQAAIAASIASYPVAAQFYQARDPRLLAQLDAMAAILAEFSVEQDVAAMEPFTKARDVTVLADAAVKGILPFGKSGRYKIKITNASAVPFSVLSGRRLQDTQGRSYTVDLGATIPANGFAFVEAVQQTEKLIDHVVGVFQPFYTIEVPQPDLGRYIASVRLRDAAFNEYAFTTEFVNVADGDKVFHLFTDEQRRLFVELGAQGLAGFQPTVGTALKLTVIETEGAFDLSSGSPFAFEYAASLYESGASLTLDSVLSPGESPLDLSTLRELASYPSIYDSNAVYLGNFDFLVRRNLSPFTFLSVWNERVEEEVRGPSVDNINCLFVSAIKAGVATLTLQEQIRKIILDADDSYRVVFKPTVVQEIAVSVYARVSSIYDFASVEQQIRELVLANYGISSEFAKRGQTKILKKRLYDLLETNVQALQGSVSDMDIIITDPLGSILPENFRYVSEASLMVTIEQAT